MARTPSNMLALGTKAPEFSLLEPLTQKYIQLADFKEKPVLIIFTCNHCPYVILIKEVFSKLAKSFQKKGVEVIAINSNDVENYSADSPEKMIEDSKANNYSFPYLFDESQQVAIEYKAACTPDLFLFDKKHELYYRGQFDDARPNTDIPVTGADLNNAIELLLSGKPSPENQKASLGCNIKWKQGNEPES